MTIKELQEKIPEVKIIIFHIRTYVGQFDYG